MLLLLQSATERSRDRERGGSKRKDNTTQAVENVEEEATMRRPQSTHDLDFRTTSKDEDKDTIN